MILDQHLLHSADCLAREARLGQLRSLTPLSGGKNNRVFLLEAEHGRAFLKAYFRHPDDQRDRLATEFAFSRYAWGCGIRALPRPLACDPNAELGLFEFIAGRALGSGEVDDRSVDQALGFFRELNRNRQCAEAFALPQGSESCFSLGEHLELVGRRVSRLKNLVVESSIDAEAKRFVEGELAPAWASAERWVRNQLTVTGGSLSERLATNERCLSPSDFGFHNAILADDGVLRFVDFEYAGWDDPARTICDFFCQPAVPVAEAAFGHFARSIAAAMPTPELHLWRAKLLWPVYRLKWCCIVLNDFLHVGGRRRQFSDADAPVIERKSRQLTRARELFSAIARSQQFDREMCNLDQVNDSTQSLTTRS